MPVSQTNRSLLASSPSAGGFSGNLIRHTFHAQIIAAGGSICAPNPVSAPSALTPNGFTKFIAIQGKAHEMWQPGEVITWRGIFREHIWHVQPSIVVRDSPSEIILTLLPGTECIAEEHYPRGKRTEYRRWFFVDHDWKLAKYTWQTNRLLLLLEPQKFYSTILFWDHASSEFLFYYINFQLPLQRTFMSIDTLDLDLDLIIQPDFRYEWKDVDDYHRAIEHGVISPAWIQGIEHDTVEIFDRLNNRQYPFDGSWLDWIPEPTWLPPTLPQDWDRI